MSILYFFTLYFAIMLQIFQQTILWTQHGGKERLPHISPKFNLIFPQIIK